MRRRFACFAMLAASLAAPRDAAANMAQAIVEGERFGALIPRKATAVRVDRETLSFDLAADLASAKVQATYWMTAGAATTIDVAFVVVAGRERVKREPGQGAVITADGAPVPFRVVRADELLAPRLAAWLGAHQGIDELLRRHPADGDQALAAAVREAGGSCSDGCADLVRWRRGAEGAGGDRAPDEVAFAAAREAIPSEVEALVRGWSTLGEPLRLTWLVFDLAFTPGQTREVSVTYTHAPSEDLAARVNTTFVYDYLLSPAKAWTSFGPVDLSVRAPRDAMITSNLPLTKDGDLHRTRLSGLPLGELRLEAMSRGGLWLGMTTSGGYWVIVVASMAAAAIGAGAATGRLWRNGSARRRAALRVVFGGAIAAGAATAAAALLSVVLPNRALGFGYGGILGVILLILLAGPTGIVASFVSARRS